MSRTMSFKELVRLIHPDTCPNVVDAGDKMRTAKLYRKEPEELFKLAVRWGVAFKRPEKKTLPPSRTATVKGVERRGRKVFIRPAPRTKPKPRKRAIRTWMQFPEEDPRSGEYVVVRTLEDAIVQVVRLTPKRVYFYHNDRRTFASMCNVTVIRKVTVEI